MFKCAIKEQKLAYFISVCRINWSFARLGFSSFSFSSFLIFLMSSLRLMMFALKFHLPTSQTDNFCETRPRLLNVLRMLTVCPWSTPVWLLTSACIETVPFHKFHKTVANRVTHLDTGWPPFAVPERRSGWSQRRIYLEQKKRNLDSFKLSLHCLELADQSFPLLCLSPDQWFDEMLSSRVKDCFLKMPNLWRLCAKSM